jgi:hypothetical protein
MTTPLHGRLDQGSNIDAETRDHPGCIGRHVGEQS